MTLQSTTSVAIALAAEGANTPKDQWVHLIPAGRVFGRDGRGPYVLTDPNAVITATRQYAGRKLVAIDYDHQIDHAAKNGQPAPAAGWIKGLQARQDGIWGLVEWTERATAALTSREYRYLSPVFTHTPDGKIISLLRASLTNNPNLELTALASAGGTMTDMTELCQLLGLPQDADISAITVAVRDLITAKHAANPDPARYVPIGDFERVTAELNKTNKGVSLQAAEIAVNSEIERGRLPPFLKDWGVSLCSVNKPAFDAFTAKTGGAVSRLFTAEAPGHPPSSRSATRLTDEQQAVCAALGHNEDDFLKQGRSR